MASILNVDKIRANGSTIDALTIDSGGRASLAKVPHLSRTYNGDMSVISTNTNVPFAENQATYGFTVNADSTEFTVLYAGIYLINVFFLSNQHANNKITTRINGSVVCTAFTQGSGSTYDSASSTIIKLLSANDVLTFNTSNHDGAFYQSGHTGISVVRIQS